MADRAAMFRNHGALVIYPYAQDYFGSRLQD
jgi:hypothetical protein